ncbi:unnamed protein product [Sphagnum jensenii]|uniref:Uncharacterized protein n=1 Tax=Sphagnum jensenii TaxID=128206 RepID=A0ABP0XCP2_9BRYO
MMQLLQILAAVKIANPAPRTSLELEGKLGMSAACVDRPGSTGANPDNMDGHRDPDGLNAPGGEEAMERGCPCKQELAL